jgi:hypothetical protein
MDRKEFDILRQELVEEVNKTLSAKGVEYQKNENVLSNFETNAQDLGLSPFQIWSIYFTKHTKSIINAIKNKPENPSDPKLSEPLEGRIIDAIAYLTLLYAMINKKNK